MATDKATDKEVYATVVKVLVDQGVLKEKSFVDQASAKILNQSPYKAYPDRITDNTVSDVSAALANLDRANYLANLNKVGLGHTNAKENLANELNTIGKAAGGQSVAGLVQQTLAKLNEGLDDAKNALNGYRNDPDQGKGTEAALNREKKGEHSIRDTQITQRVDGPNTACLGDLSAPTFPKGASANRGPSCSTR